MTETDELALLQAVADVLKDYVPKAIAPISARIDELHVSIAAIPAGPRGEKGDRGDDGKPGERGPAGERGEKGDPGECGAPGKVGERGERGEKGERGEQGISVSVVGEKGADGKDGRDGRDGLNGKDGRDGMDGRDALSLDPLDAIDETRSYARGTWACHRGGLVRYDGFKWKCMVRGISHESDELSPDFRTRIRKTFYTDGTVYEVSTVSPVMIYREVFKEGTEYTRGDCVTYDGAVWICVVDIAKGKPGMTPDWKEAVRRGREGKPGKDGARGIDGKDGKDFRPFGARP